MKVECINDDWSLPLSFITYPVKGQIYHVRSIITREGKRGYYLEEIVNEPGNWRDGFFEPAFAAESFRPITDISALTRLTKVRELEDA